MERQYLILGRYRTNRRSYSGTSVKDENGNDIMQEQIERNYSRIKDEVEQIVQDEMERIKADPELRKRLLPDEKDEEDND